MVKLESVSREAFAAFGEVVEFPAGCQDAFFIVDSEDTYPWRLAIFRYSNKEIRQMENHPSSKESFEPLSGMTVLVVAENQTPEQYRAFILDKPVLLKKGIWHQVLSLTAEASVKITENREVNSEFYSFEKNLQVVLL